MLAAKWKSEQWILKRNLLVLIVCAWHIIFTEMKFTNLETAASDLKSKCELFATEIDVRFV